MYLLKAVFLIAILVHSIWVWGAPAVSVVFVLDESGSVSSSNFQLETEGFIEALKSLPADARTEVSVVGFATSSTVIRDKILVDSAGSADLQSALTNNTQSGGTTAMAGAINTSSGLLSNSTAPTKIICLATDGQPNSPTSTRTAADNAFNAGIVLAPIGIGLSSSGKTFLDSIAHPDHSPVPNPSTFQEFGAVVQNSCIGLVQSAINLNLTPNPVDFGSVGPQTAGLCGGVKAVGLENASNRSAEINKVFIRGLAGQTDDSHEYSLVSVAGTPIDSLTTPFMLPPLYATTIEVAINPNFTPADGAYDAELVVEALELRAGASSPTVVEFTTRLTAPVASDCFDITVIDASPTIHVVAADGVPKTISGNEVSEPDVAAALQVPYFGRFGLVADGNARLFVVAALSQTSGMVRFEIPQPAQTGAVLHPLTNSPNDSGATTLEVAIQEVDGRGQATAILRAGEGFLGGNDVPEINFQVIGCLLDQQGNCSSLKKNFPLRERRAPVVLIHGLWADNTSWGNYDPRMDTYGDGVARELRNEGHFEVGFFTYNGNQGPTKVIRSNNTEFSDSIKGGDLTADDSGTGVCNNMVNKEMLACTRADIVAHSMGGLMARQFLYQGLSKHRGNFFAGSIRRLITLGTPHLGSQLANMLLYDNSAISNCIVDRDPNTPGIQNVDIEDAKQWLACGGGGFNPSNDIEDCRARENAKLTDEGAIDDIAVGSDLLNTLDAYDPILQTREDIWTRALWGNAGVNELNLNSPGQGLVADNIKAAGCRNNNHIFHGEKTDGVVPENSARYHYADASTEELQNVLHVGMGTNVTVATRVRELLNGPLSDKFEYFPYPVRGDGRIIVQRSNATGSIYSVESSPLETVVASLVKMISRSFSTLVGISDAQAQGLSALNLSVDKTMTVPGDTLAFTATVTGQPETAIYFSDYQSFELEDDTPPYEWIFPLGQAAAGQYRFGVHGIVDGQIQQSNFVTVLVVPDTSNLSQLTFEPGDPLWLKIGSTEPLQVNGRFKDGYDRPLTASVTGTTYSENIVSGLMATPGDSPVISVAPEGLVTALQLGEAEVVAENNGFKTVRRINVVPGESLVENPGVIGDANGDGQINSLDLIAAANEILGVNTASGNPDCNQDSQVNSLDLVCIANKILGLN